VSTAPTPVSEVSTSTVNCEVVLAWMRTGAKQNWCFSSMNVVSTSGVQQKGMEVEVSAVSGAATKL